MKCKYCNGTGLIETSTLSEEDEKFYDEMDIPGKCYMPCYECNARNKHKNKKRETPYQPSKSLINWLNRK